MLTFILIYLGLGVLEAFIGRDICGRILGNSPTRFILTLIFWPFILYAFIRRSKGVLTYKDKIIWKRNNDKDSLPPQQ